jgi:hypothetical protein
MKGAMRRLVLLCLVVGSAIAIVVPTIGSAGNRPGEASFVALPGTRVTVGQSIAFRATLANTGKSTFTHVIFRMLVPYVLEGSPPYAEAQLLQSTCPTQPVVITTSGGHEWTCDFGKLDAGRQFALTSVWAPPTPTSGSCEGCLQTTGRWTIKEGLNDTASANDTVPSGGVPISASLLSSSSTTEAGGYATNAMQCSDPLGAGSLTTSQALSGSNVTSTTVCLPSPLPTDAFDLGLATALLETAHLGSDPGHQQFDASNVCIAALGQTCDAGYTPVDLSPNVATVVLRGFADALPKHTKVTAVYHDGVLLPSCPKNGPTPANGCVVSITLVQTSSGWHTTAWTGKGYGGGHGDDGGSKGGGIWVAVVKSSTNGRYTW